MKRKLLFVCFSDDDCRLTHALWWAKELHEQGHEVKVLLEGMGTRSLAWLADPEYAGFAQAFSAAKTLGLIAGVCQAASSGCAADDLPEKPVDIARRESIPLCNTLNGHAGIARFVSEGYEVVVF